MSFLNNNVVENYQDIDELHFGRVLNDQRKALGIDLATLELQTGISVSTLKRLFRNPSQVKFSSVLLVAKTLGMPLCYAK